jgi:hypothetical protein
MTAPLSCTDLQAPETVWMLWHGGHSYAPGYVDDHTETLASDDVVWTMLERFYNRDGSTPCVDETSEAHVFFRDPRGESDPYPDARVLWSGYHNRFVWDYA